MTPEQMQEWAKSDHLSRLPYQQIIDLLLISHQQYLETGVLVSSDPLSETCDLMRFSFDPQCQDTFIRIRQELHARCERPDELTQDERVAIAAAVDSADRHANPKAAKDKVKWLPLYWTELRDNLRKILEKRHYSEATWY